MDTSDTLHAPARSPTLQVFLPCLSHRFLRLSLQGIGRVGAWAVSKEVLALHPDDIVPIAADLSRCAPCLRLGVQAAS